MKKEGRRDRFERMVLNRTYPDMCVDKDVAIDLLRNEHAWMKRMVKKVDAWACQELADNDDVIAEILKQLAQRRK